jgi:dTDP-4-dehydrorhamnose 3,5-epimerase-like enzyme
MIHAARKPTYQLLDFRPKGGDDSGWLISLQTGDQVPFEIRRVYYIFGTQPGVRRGMHAHRNLEQIVVCTSGRCTFTVDDGTEREVFRLDSPQRGLYLGSNVWREMSHFSPDCVLMVLASRHYDTSDYILSYDEFLAGLKKTHGKDA